MSVRGQFGRDPTNRARERQRKREITPHVNKIHLHQTLGNLLLTMPSQLFLPYREVRRKEKLERKRCAPECHASQSLAHVFNDQRPITIIIPLRESRQRHRTERKRVLLAVDRHRTAISPYRHIEIDLDREIDDSLSFVSFSLRMEEDCRDFSCTITAFGLEKAFRESLSSRCTSRAGKSTCKLTTAARRNDT